MMGTLKEADDVTVEDIDDEIIERTENLLGMHPMSNQKLILDTARYWLESGIEGSYDIYKWCICYLTSLETDMNPLKFMDEFQEAENSFYEIIKG